MQENEVNEAARSDEQPTPAIAQEMREEPQMSEAATLANIFIEPENTFRDLRRKPRFIIAGLIVALLVGVYAFGLAYKMGDAAMRSFVAEQIEKGPGGDRMSKADKDNAVDMQMKISEYTRFAVPVFVFISFFIGGLLYWLGAKAFGGTGSFMQNLSVWVYSGFAPAVVSLIATFIVLVFKAPEDIELATSQQGLVHANLGFFIPKDMAIVKTLLATLDVFAIWGWFLAAVGLAAVNKMSKASSWTIVLLITLIGLGFRLVGAFFSGNPA